jgi:hypothetical protein
LSIDTDDANKRIHFEFHLAGGPNYDFDAESIGVAVAVSFKINLCNPKILNASDILVNINRLRNPAEVTGFSLPTITGARIETITRNLRRKGMVSRLLRIPSRSHGYWGY